MSAREEILGRIRRSLADVPPADVTEVRRDYRRTLDGESIVDLFAEMVSDYKATVRRTGADEVGVVVAEILSGRGIKRVGIPEDLPRQWLPTSVQSTVDSVALSTGDLDGLDGAVTGAALGIALTGTLVLDGGARQGRRVLTLVPDYHLCIIETGQIVGSLPEAVDRLDPARPLTFVSGPSATSDIELNRVEGVHGPRTLDVLIVEGGSA